MATNKPAKKIRIGYITATIWSNKSGDNTFYSATITRSFKGDDGNWAESDSFNFGDLPVVAKVADMATNWILAQ